MRAAPLAAVVSWQRGGDAAGPGLCAQSGCENLPLAQADPCLSPEIGSACLLRPSDFHIPQNASAPRRAGCCRKRSVRSCINQTPPRNREALAPAAGSVPRRNPLPPVSPRGPGLCRFHGAERGRASRCRAEPAKGLAAAGARGRLMVHGLKKSGFLFPKPPWPRRCLLTPTDLCFSPKQRPARVLAPGPMREGFPSHARPELTGAFYLLS